MRPPKDVELTWMGDAVGKWEGDKLHPTWRLYEQVCEENNRCVGGFYPQVASEFL